MIRYVFKEDAVLAGRKGADPQVIGEALERVATENAGRLTPQATVEAARPRGHALHRFFEWRQKEAAEKYRLSQARHLIGCIRIVDDAAPQPAYAYVSIVAEKGNGRAYVPAHQVITSAFFQAQAFKQAERDLLALENRYRMIADLCGDLRVWRERLAERRRLLLDAPLPALAVGT
jgi:hypothetical protein